MKQLSAQRFFESGAKKVVIAMQGDYVAAVASLVGVIVGFGLTVAKDAFTQRRQLVASRKQFARALLAEASILKDRYMSPFGSYIEKWKVNEPLNLGYYPRSTNLFRVYDGNTDKLGLFDAQDAETIVKAYTLAKAQAESISGAVEIVRDLERPMAELKVKDNPLWHGYADQLRTYTNEVGPRLQKVSKDLLSATDDAISILERYATP